LVLISIRRVDTRSQSQGILQRDGHEETSHERRVHVRVEGSGFEAWDAEIRAYGLGFGVWGEGCTVLDVGLGF